jgi:peptide/nickel transport system permease protein
VIQYLIRRLLESILILFVISMLMFTLISLYPGGIMNAYEENPDVTSEDYQRLRDKYGLDDPIPIRYAKWLRNVLTGDWGVSFVSKQPALDEIMARLPNTLLLMGVAFVVTLLIAVPLGIISALRQYSLLDNVLTVTAFGGNSLPVFWFGLLLIMIFHVWLGWFPGSGMWTLGEEKSLADLASHMVLPVTMLALVSAAGYMRYMRSSMLDVVRQDYIRTARSKGINERRVIVSHALRNALIPLVTLIALDLPALFGGALFTETIFGWPGMARLFYERSLKSDIPVLMAILIIFSALILLSNLLADLVYTFLDPRIRLGETKTS